MGPLRKIKRVALCGGSGSSLIDAAAVMGADVFVTGDVKHHDAHKALGLGMALIDGGHYGTEKNATDIIKGHIEKHVMKTEFTVDIIVSSINTDPFVVF